MFFREEDLVIERIRRTGPGGQHRNKRETGIRLTHLPTGLVVMATEERSQSMNLERAYRRLGEKLEALFRKKKKRVRTKVSASQRAKRLDTKKKHSRKKDQRKPIQFD
jgi:protein subunit release factor A